MSTPQDRTTNMPLPRSQRPGFWFGLIMLTHLGLALAPALVTVILYLLHQLGIEIVSIPPDHTHTIAPSHTRTIVYLLVGSGLALGVSAIIYVTTFFWFFVLAKIGSAYIRRKPEGIKRKMAISGALAAISIPNLILIISVPAELFSGASDAGQATGLLAAFSLVINPILGLIGGSIGLIVGFVVSKLRYSKQA